MLSGLRHDVLYTWATQSARHHAVWTIYTMMYNQKWSVKAPSNRRSSFHAMFVYAMLIIAPVGSRL